MKIAALLAVRNEELYLDRCIKHYERNGIDVYIIDNNSTDLSRKIAESHLGKTVKEIFDIPYDGFFDLTKQLEFKEKIALEIKADWFLHCDADEIREAPNSSETLNEAIQRVDSEGFNAINFDEFVFLPLSGEKSHEGSDYVETMKYYYFLSKNKPNRINAWKNNHIKIDLTTSGGHALNFPEKKLYPVNFLMRHYIALSREHMIKKYKNERIYSQTEIEQRGWHRLRASFAHKEPHFPTADEMKCTDFGFPDRSDPWERHKVFG